MSNYIKIQLKTKINDIRDYFLYDLLKFQVPQIDFMQIVSIMKQSNEEIKLKISMSKDGFVIVFPEYPEMILFAKNYNEILDVIQDGVLVYFDIPRYHILRNTLKYQLNRIYDDKGNIVLDRNKTDSIFINKNNQTYRLKL